MWQEERLQTLGVVHDSRLEQSQNERLCNPAMFWRGGRSLGPGFDLISIGPLCGEFFGATLEQTKNGSELVSANEATTWIDIAYLEGRRSIQLSYGPIVTTTMILEHFWIIPKKSRHQCRVAARNFSWCVHRQICLEPFFAYDSESAN
jgi:hypothetical protein